MLKKILIVDSVYHEFPVILSSKGIECETHLDLDYEGFLNIEDQYDGLIIRSRFKIDQEIINSKKHLKFIIRLGSGMENIDVEYAERKGILCHNTPDGNAPSVAEHCLALLFSVIKHLPTANKEVRNGEWLRNKNKGLELKSKKVGIIGFGHTGKAFAKLLSHFGCEIFVYDKYNFGFKEDYITEVPLNTLLKNCDVISLHINYLPENYHFFNKDLFKKVKNPFILINTSRGLVVDTDAVVWGLNRRRIEWACLDVLEYENEQLNLQTREYWNKTMISLSKMEKVTLTPHIAGQTLDAEKRHAEIAIDIISKFYFN